MPWKYSGRILRPGKAWTDNDGNQHSGVWMRYSSSQKTTFGITWEDPAASEEPFDKRFYFGRETDGTLIPRSLTDVLWVDDDGNAINDPLTGAQGKTKGLKTLAIETAKTQAAGKLAPYDWYVIRHTEKSTAIPSSITTYRDSVRTACAAIETKVTNAANLTAFMALYDTPVDSNGNPTGNAPIADWPDEI